MKKSRLITWLTRLAWVVLAFDVLLIFALSTDIGCDSTVLSIVYEAWLVLSFSVATMWLVFRYRQFFRTWLGWAIPIAVFLTSSIVTQGVIPVYNEKLVFFSSLLFITSMICIGLTTAILLYYCDAGLGLIGWSSVASIWVLLLSRRFQGNFIELLLDGLNYPGASSLWWFGPLTCIWTWAVTLGGVAFCLHTLRLIARELR